MNKQPLIAAVVAVAFMLGAHGSKAQQIDPTVSPITGVWEGKLNAGVQLRLVLHVAERDGVLTASVDSPDQGAKGIPVNRFEFDADKLSFAITPIRATYRATLDGDNLSGVWRQGGAELPLNLERVITPTALARPQTPQPPYPYSNTSMAFDSADGVTNLAGTLSMPAGDGPFRAVILLSGSGPQDRDSTLFEHKPFLVLADYLTRHGFAVLRFDDRGVGASRGDRTMATMDDFVQDAQGAVNTLWRHDNISSVGLLGHSEGAMVADIVANDSAQVEFLIRLAGPAVDSPALLDAQSRAIFRAAGGAPEHLNKLSEMNRHVYALAASDRDTATLGADALDYMQQATQTMTVEQRAMLGMNDNLEAKAQALTSPWFRDFMRRDAGTVLARLKPPVLALFGGKDMQVLANQNAPAAKSKLRHPLSEVKVYPNLNHLFQTATTGAPAEYGQIEQTLAPKVLADLVTWLRDLPVRRD
ncbi:MAG: alpha/beta hydrolase family protein [Gammaproteobacteria bacterium]